jgi:hypothetical protein
MKTAFVIAVAAADRTKLLVEICRHGAREPTGNTYPLTINDPYDNF